MGNRTEVSRKSVISYCDNKGSDPSHGPVRIPIDYPGILTGVHPEQNLPILAGDTVVVP